MIKAAPGKPANSEHCFPYEPFPGPEEHNLTGRHFSYLKVKGYSGPAGNKRGSEWVCRCICGRYELRNSRAMKKQSPDRDYLCSRCEDDINRRKHQL